MPITLIPLLGAIVGLLLISSGTARLQRLAEQRLAAERPPLPRTYAQGVRASARAVHGGRGLKLSRATKAFARATGQGETYRRACRRMLVGLLVFQTGAVLASALHGEEQAVRRHVAGLRRHAAGGQDNPHAGGSLALGPGQREAVHLARHLDVADHDEHVGSRLQQGEGLVGVGGLHDPEPGLGQHLGGQHAHERLVFDEQPDGLVVTVHVHQRSMIS